MGWEEGIFTVMSAMITFIGIIIATRFLYIDNQYSKIISKQEKFISDLENYMNNTKTKENFESSDDMAAHVKSYQIAIGYFTSKQDENKKGVVIDFLCMFGIVILALIATNGYFGNETASLSISLFILFIVSLGHFLTHIKTVLSKDSGSF